MDITLTPHLAEKSVVLAESDKLKSAIQEVKSSSDALFTIVQRDHQFNADSLIQLFELEAGKVNSCVSRCMKYVHFGDNDLKYREQLAYLVVWNDRSFFQYVMDYKLEEDKRFELVKKLILEFGLKGPLECIREYQFPIGKRITLLNAYCFHLDKDSIEFKTPELMKRFEITFDVLQASFPDGYGIGTLYDTTVKKLKTIQSLPDSILPEKWADWLLVRECFQDDPFFVLDMFRAEHVVAQEALSIVSISSLGSYYGSSVQDRYSTLMQAFIVLVTAHKKKHNLNFYQILLILSVMRQEMSSQAGNRKDRVLRYGMPRIIKMFTGFTSCQKMYPKLLEKAKDGNVTIRGVIDGREIPLSILTTTEGLIHTDAKEIRPILEYVKTLYEKASAMEDEREIREISGQIFWWICHAKPWILGDPSIAEMLIRSLWREKGISSPAWKEWAVPWQEASIAEDVEAFGKMFHTFFVE